MSSPYSQTPLTGDYDQSLLAAAPEATRAAKQEGYNVDLLEPRRSARSTPSQSANHIAGAPKETYSLPAAREAALDDAPRKTSFWRSGRGIILLVVLAVVIIGAVVGGAVGGTVGKSKQPASGAAAGGGGTKTKAGSPSASGTGGPGQAVTGDAGPPSASTNGGQAPALTGLPSVAPGPGQGITTTTTRPP